MRAPILARPMPITADRRTEEPRRVSADGIRTTVVLPAYNEGAALPHVLDELGEYLDSSYEVLVVDDGSTDDTGDVAKRYPVRLVQHASNRGKGVAIRTGITEAQGENVVIMDADATYPVPAIKEMVELLDDHDLVRGVRESEPESMPFVNRVGNWLFNKLLAISHGLEGTDHLSGLYAIRRSAAVRLGTEARGFDIETEIGIKAKARGLREAEIPISYLPRVGEKKLSPWKDGLRILGRVIVLLLIYNPTVNFIVPGLVLMAISVTGAVLLSNGPVHTSYLGLNIHSFIVAALGLLAAFQLVIFGVAAALYGVEAGKEPPHWLRRVISVRFRLAVGLLGLVLMLGSLAKLVQLTIQWAGNNVFTDTRALVLSTSFLVLGLQVISAVLFISIFSGRLSRMVEEDAAERSGSSG
jgi:glycosyltransferase involved in cell wall biosynthesis